MKEKPSSTPHHERKKEASKFATGCKMGSVKSRYANKNTKKAGGDGVRACLSIQLLC